MLSLHLLLPLQKPIYCVLQTHELASLPFFSTDFDFGIQKLENFGSVGIAVLLGTTVEGHNTDAAAFDGIYEREYVSHFVLDIKRNVLEPAEVEEGLHSEFLEGRMGKDGHVETVAVRRDEVSQKMS